jgi:hypothetical protein
MVPGREWRDGEVLKSGQFGQSVDYNAAYQRPYGHVGREVKVLFAMRQLPHWRTEGPGSATSDAFAFHPSQRHKKVASLLDVRSWAFPIDYLGGARPLPTHVFPSQKSKPSWGGRFPFFHGRCARRAVMARGSSCHAMRAARTAQNTPQLNCLQGRIRTPLEHTTRMNCVVTVSREKRNRRPSPATI